MTVYLLADPEPFDGNWRDMPGVQRGAPCAAWPPLKNGDKDAVAKRNCAWSATDARKGIREPAATIRGGMHYVYDPLAPVMRHYAGARMGQSLFA